MKRVMTYIVSIAVLLLVWEIASLVVNAINQAPLLPGPFDALSQVVKNAAELQRHFFASAWRLILPCRSPLPPLFHSASSSGVSAPSTALSPR